MHDFGTLGCTAAFKHVRHRLLLIIFPVAVVPGLRLTEGCEPSEAADFARHCCTRSVQIHESPKDAFSYTYVAPAASLRATAVARSGIRFLRPEMQST
jgi:hypothetical protein